MKVYLQRFLFTSERTNTPVAALSGGERSRLLLARLFTRPSNVLVLDEPTNDLDLETLELLTEYSGTILPVSHDRSFRNDVVTSTLVFVGQGWIAEYVCGYDDWLRQRPAAKPAPAKRAPTLRPAKKPSSGMLSYNDQRELDAPPGRIKALETERSSLFAPIEASGDYRSPAAEIARDTERSKRLEAELAAACDCWQELESLREAGGS